MAICLIHQPRSIRLQRSSVFRLNHLRKGRIMADEPKGVGQDVESALIIKAGNNEAFRQELLADPEVGD